MRVPGKQRIHRSFSERMARFDRIIANCQLIRRRCAAIQPRLTANGQRPTAVSQ